MSNNPSVAIFLYLSILWMDGILFDGNFIDFKLIYMYM